MSKRVRKGSDIRKPKLVQQDVSILTQYGELFGEVDIIAGRERSYTCT